MSIAISCLLMASCATYEKTGPIMGVQSNNVNTYVAADFDYANAKRVEGSVTKKTLFGFIPLVKNGKRYYSASNHYRGLSATEQQALYRAKEAGNVDVIMEPYFEKENHCYFFGLFTKQMVKVSAWGLNYKGLKEDSLYKRTILPDDYLSKESTCEELREDIDTTRKEYSSNLNIGIDNNIKNDSKYDATNKPEQKPKHTKSSLLVNDCNNYNRFSIGYTGICFTVASTSFVFVLVID